MTIAELRGDAVILACAISGGIHGALVPRHLGEHTGAGVGFIAATLLLAALAVTLNRSPRNTVALAGAAVVFVGLLVGYAASVTTGLPVLHPEPETVDGLALATKAIEAIGFLAASSLLRRREVTTLTRGQAAGPNTARVERPVPLALVTLVAAFGVLGALAVSDGHDGGHGNVPHHASGPSTR